MIITPLAVYYYLVLRLNLTLEVRFYLYISVIYRGRYTLSTIRYDTGWTTNIAGSTVREAVAATPIMPLKKDLKVHMPDVYKGKRTKLKLFLT